MNQPTLILASSSPRRVELLRQINLDFTVIPSKADELHDHSIPAREICVINAERKASWVADLHPDDIVLGADTLVTLNNELFGKPISIVEAEEMLFRLQGQTHEVITGVSIQHRSRNLKVNFAEVTTVTFKALSADEIRDYISKVYVLDKAGAYAIQEHGDLIIASIAGSYSNVVGLPTERVWSELEKIRSQPLPAG